MKKVYLTLIVMMFATAGLMAQAQIGIRAGLNLTTISEDFDLAENQPWRTGFLVGLATQFRAGRNFSIAPELMYEQRGYKVEGTVGEADARFNYLSLPVLFRVHFGGDILQGYVNAGPTVSYWLGGTQTATVPGLFDVHFEEGEFQDRSIVFEEDDGPWGYDDARRLEFGAAIGGGIVLDTEGGTFLIDLRYTHGFTNIATVPYLENFQNRALSASLIYLVPPIRRGAARTGRGTGTGTGPGEF